MSNKKDEVEPNSQKPMGRSLPEILNSQIAGPNDFLEKNLMFSGRHFAALVLNICKGCAEPEVALNEIIQLLEPQVVDNKFVLIECDSQASAKVFIEMFKSYFEPELKAAHEAEVQEDPTGESYYPDEFKYNENWNYIKCLYR